MVARRSADDGRQTESAARCGVAQRDEVRLPTPARFRWAGSVSATSAADTGPPDDERSQTKKSIGRQPPPAVGRSRSRAGRRAATRLPRDRPARWSLRNFSVRDITDSNSPFWNGNNEIFTFERYEGRGRRQWRLTDAARKVRYSRRYTAVYKYVLWLEIPSSPLPISDIAIHTEIYRRSTDLFEGSRTAQNRLWFRSYQN